MIIDCFGFTIFTFFAINSIIITIVMILKNFTINGFIWIDEIIIKIIIIGVNLKYLLIDLESG